jgi:WD40 repeat protein
MSRDTVIKKDGIDALFELKYQLIGSSGDILDIAVIPCAVGDDNTKESLAEKIAIVSNSSNIQIMDSDNFHISTLYGHTDIVLAVDICPDG